MGRWVSSGAKLDRVPVETRNYVLAITGHPIEAWLHNRVDGRPLGGHVALLGPELRS
jgi:hypothetical protein